MNCTSFQYSTHAVKRMLEKNITTFEVEQTASLGEIIQDYHDDKPYPSVLLLYFVDTRPIHVVLAKNIETGTCIIITCYQPDEAIWQNTFKEKNR